MDYDDAFQQITTYLDTIEHQLLSALNEKNYEKTYYSLFFIKSPLHRNYMLTIFAQAICKNFHNPEYLLQ